jgi:hypothetical protein
VQAFLFDGNCEDIGTIEAFYIKVSFYFRSSFLMIRQSSDGSSNPSTRCAQYDIVHVFSRIFPLFDAMFVRFRFLSYVKQCDF